MTNNLQWCIVCLKYTFHTSTGCSEHHVNTITIQLNEYHTLQNKIIELEKEIERLKEKEKNKING